MTEITPVESIISDSMARASSLDYVENLKRFVPQPIMRKVLVEYTHWKREPEDAHEFLAGFKSDNDAGVIEPPLSVPLAKEIDFVLSPQEADRGLKLPSAFLCAWAMVEEESEVRITNG